MARGRSGGRGPSAQGRGRGPGAGTSMGGRGGRGGQGQSPRGGARGGKRSFGAKGFRRAVKSTTALSIVDFNKRIAEAKKQQTNATTDAAKKAAAAALKKAEAAKKAYMAQAAKQRESARSKQKGDGATAMSARGRSSAGRSSAGRSSAARGTQGRSRRGGMTGTGGQSPGPRGQRGGRGGRGGGGGGAGGGGGSGGCFVAETLVQMLDGTTKPIIDIQVGEHTKGGIVESKMKFLPTNIYNYKGVEVSGSHWVIEDNQFIEVENSKHGILTDKIETVYCFKTSENRIWVNDIEFGDYESGSQEDWEPYFKQVKEKLNRELLLKQ